MWTLLTRDTSQNAKGCVAGTACHAGGSGGFTISAGSAHSTYLEVTQESSTCCAPMKRVTPGVNAADSVLLKKATGSVGHSGGARWTIGDADYNRTLLWIQQGALEN